MSETTEKLKCGHCGASASMPIVASYTDSEQFDPQEPEVALYELLMCPSCNEPILRHRWRYAYGDPGGDSEWTSLYPQLASAPLGLPPKVARAYDAARKVKDIDPNAFGMMQRRVLEFVCADRSTTGNDLNARLECLAARGDIPDKLAKMAHGIRDLGNIGAHGIEKELTPEEIPYLDALGRAILEYVYGAPALLAKVEERLATFKSKAPS